MALESENDPGEEIAEAIAARLTSLSLSLSFTAETPDDLTAAYELERPELTVLVAPFDEEGEHFDRGGKVVETFQTNIVVVRKLSAEFGRKRLSRFARELKTGLRGFHLKMDSGQPMHWIGDSTPVKFDPDKIREMNQFHCLHRILHRGIV